MIAHPDTKRILIGGCGRVGSGLARTLDDAGVDVAIIDRDGRSFRRLGEGYGGRTVRGIVFDRTTLIRAGIEEADAFVAVTSGDNSNIVSARTARDHFGVTNVVARIYDPKRAEIFERHGVTTIASARWTTDAILTHLLRRAGRVEAGIGPGEGDVVIIGRDLPPAPAGPWEVESLARQGKWLVAAITRAGQTTVPVPRQLVQASERIHLAVQRTALADAEAFLDTLGQES